MHTTAVIHLNRLRDNIQAVRARIGENRRICVPVKANAYGHGALEIARASLEAGVFCLGVSSVAEGMKLRKGGIKSPILVFSQPCPGDIPGLIEAGLTPFVSDEWFASALNEQAGKRKIPVHIKIDTGMGRIGCYAEEAVSLARRIASLDRLELEGTATHFAAADSNEESDFAYTKKQLALFLDAVKAVKDAGIEPGILHAANSGAIILHPDSWFDMVRPGILLYGYKTAEENKTSSPPPVPIKVQPVMELRTTVVLIKKVKKGESVSYGRTWTAEKNTNIAVLPVGYADGLQRLASGKWQALIGGKFYPLVGRICMDLCCADLGPNTDVSRWDEALIFGPPAPDAAAFAAVTGTIPYEITCNISERVPRVYRE